MYDSFWFSDSQRARIARFCRPPLLPILNRLPSPPLGNRTP